MPAVADDKVEFSAKVPRSEYDIFKERFPQYGAVNWFINTTLAEFNRKVEENPASTELINQAISKMLMENRDNGS